MIATYSQAHRRLNHILELFIIGCAAGTLVGVIDNDWWFATVWLLAGIITGFIEVSSTGSAVSASAPEKDFADKLPANDDEHVFSERADERAFEGKFLKFTTLLAALILASGFALGIPWWTSLLAAAVAWFTSMFGIALLCAPRKNGEWDAVD